MFPPMTPDPVPPQAPIAAPASAPAAPLRAAFDGRRWPLVGLLIRNAALGLVTLGIYRFWGRTRVRAYFWRHVAVGGERFEYTGVGRELFVGFLIVAAILLPLSVAYAAVEYLTVGDGAVALAVLEGGYYALVAYLFQVALYRARRYRLSRTLWRGIEFGLTGSALAYALVAFGHLVLVVATLGATYPWRRAALASRLVNAARFGDAPFRLAARGRDLFPPYLPALAALWATVGLAVGVNGEVVTAPADELGGGRGIFDRIVWWPLLGLVPAGLLFVRYRVREFVYFVANAGLGDGISFASGLRAARIVFLYLVYAAIFVLWLAALGALAYAALFGGPAAAIGLAVLALLLFLALPIVRIAWLRVEILRAVCRTLTVDDPAAIEDIARAQRARPRRGEGLADAFDIGGL